MTKDEQFMQQAIVLALQTKQTGNFPFGAVIVYGGKIIGTGQSLELSHKDVTKHAELSAVSQASRVLKTTDLSDCVLYASGEPCVMCAAAIARAGIRTVFIGIKRQEMPAFIGQREIGTLRLAADRQYKIRVIDGDLREEAMRLFDGIVSTPRRRLSSSQ